jgi:hypothetical protein
MDRPKIVSRREIPIGRVTNDGRGIVNLDDGFVVATC